VNYQSFKNIPFRIFFFRPDSDEDGFEEDEDEDGGCDRDDEAEGLVPTQPAPDEVRQTPVQGLGHRHLERSVY
jgi:hypothetical protein